jgi:hypothetical protein
MQRIPLEKAGKGMTLAKPVVNDNGIKLVREGTELTHSLIERLKSLGIQKIIVQGHPLETDGEPEKPLSVLEKELEDRFRPTQSNPLMQQLKEIFLNELRRWAEEEEHQVEHTNERIE